MSGPDPAALAAGNEATAPASTGRRTLLALSAAAAVTATVTTLPGCALLQRPSPVPMRLVYDDGACATTQAPVLLVLLPGVYMTPEELLQQGFVQALRQRGLAVDVLLADAHIGYVRDGSMRQRLHDEVLAPARAWGYRRIWLAGISLGGFVALAYAMDQPGEVEGIVALAPYLGRPTLVQALADAGGPRAWAGSTMPAVPAAQTNANANANANPKADVDADADTDAMTAVEIRLWHWLAAPASAARPDIWLGYGSDDRFAAAHRQLATLLPPDHTSVAPGGHDWPPWRTLWAQWLGRGLLPATSAGCTG